MAQQTARDVVTRYNRALEARDFTAARGFLADGLRFDGPIDHFVKADDYIGAITRLFGMVKGIENQATMVDGDEVALFYVLDTPVAKAPSRSGTRFATARSCIFAPTSMRGPFRLHPTSEKLAFLRSRPPA